MGHLLKCWWGGGSNRRGAGGVRRGPMNNEQERRRCGHLFDEDGCPDQERGTDEGEAVLEDAYDLILDRGGGASGEDGKERRTVFLGHVLVGGEKEGDERLGNDVEDGPGLIVYLIQ